MGLAQREAVGMSTLGLWGEDPGPRPLQGVHRASSAGPGEAGALAVREEHCRHCSEQQGKGGRPRDKSPRES